MWDPLREDRDYDTYPPPIAPHPNFATFVPKTLLNISIENKNGCNKVLTELSGV